MEHKTDYIYDKNGKLIYKFDTKVQYIKYKVLRWRARHGRERSLKTFWISRR